MYSKIITQRIIELQAKGFSAEETKKILLEKDGLDISVDTIYRHRKSPVGQELIAELIRQQERSIVRADSTDPPLAMKYRNELLKILTLQNPQVNVTVNATAQSKAQAESTTALLEDYDALIAAEIATEKSTLRPDNPEQPVH